MLSTRGPSVDDWSVFIDEDSADRLAPGPSHPDRPAHRAHPMVLSEAGGRHGAPLRRPLLATATWPKKPSHSCKADICGVCHHFLGSGLIHASGASAVDPPPAPVGIGLPWRGLRARRRRPTPAG